MKVKEMADNSADDLEKLHWQFEANTTSSLTTPQVDVVKEVGCSLTIDQTLNPKRKVFSKSSDEEDDGKAGINQML